MRRATSISRRQERQQISHSDREQPHPEIRESDAHPEWERWVSESCAKAERGKDLHRVTNCFLAEFQTPHDPVFGGRSNRRQVAKDDEAPFGLEQPVPVDPFSGESISVAKQHSRRPP